MAEPDQPETDAEPLDAPAEATDVPDEATDVSGALLPGEVPVELPPLSGSETGVEDSIFAVADQDSVMLDGEGLPPEFMAGLRGARRRWHAMGAAAALVAIAVAATVVTWNSDHRPDPVPRPAACPPRPQPRPTPIGSAPVVKPSHKEPDAAKPRVSEAYSLPLLEKAYADGEYTTALDQGARLMAAMDQEAPDDLLKDFIRLRYAQCCQRIARFNEAADGLAMAAESASPLVRGLALAELARAGLASGQYLNARTYAYQATGILGAIPGAEPLQNACDFMAAEALTHKVLAFHGANHLLPRDDISLPDPSASLATQSAIRAMLATGIERFARATAGVQATCPNAAGTAVARWSITSVAAPLEDVLHRVATPSALDIAWSNVEPSARRRPVRLALSGATDTRVIEVACGVSGLVARLTGDEAVIHDLRTERSAASLQALLARESVSMWRRRLLDERDEASHARAHFALGLIAEHEGDTASAIAEYALLGRRYELSSLAPAGLLRSAGIAIDLRDYAGARRYLLDLLNRHPNFPNADAVYLRLGQAAMEAGLYDNAVATYRRLYYWELSHQAQAGGAFGAGKGYHLLGQHDEAVKWFERYRLVAHGTKHDDRAEAEYLIGKSLLALAEPAKAQTALRLALATNPPQPLRTDVTLTLAASLADTGAYIEALALLHGMPNDSTPAEAVHRTVLVKARLLRTMGLLEQAVRLLTRRRDEVSDHVATLELQVELARCCVALGRTDEAHRLLDQAVAHLAPGPLAQSATADLANLHLAAGRTRQAVTLARTLLTQSPDETVRRRALATLGRAYLACQEYDRAALAFSGKVPDAKQGDSP